MYLNVLCFKKLICHQRVSVVVVLLLSAYFNSSILISGKAGACEKVGRLQCNNDKCIAKDLTCNSKDNCGDNRDGAFCGMGV